MRILWLNWRCWLNPAMGGAEVFTYEVAKRWAESGHQVTLFTSKYHGCKTEETLDGVNVVRAGGRFTVYQNARKLYDKRFSKQNFDVIIDEINTQPFFAPRYAGNTKVVALIHQLAREFWFYETPFPINSLGYHYLENHWLKQYAQVPTVTVSDSTCRDLKELGFQRVFIVPEGLNFQPIDAAVTKSPHPKIAFSGRLKRAKRPDHAIEAFKIIREKLPDAELVLFGDGPFRNRLENMSVSGVNFLGNLDNNERREKLSDCWAVVAPGVREGWGLNIIEANALGIPAVAYNAPGLRDSVKNNDTGLLALNGDIQDLAEKTLQVLTDQQLRDRLGTNALKYSKTFSWDKTADEFMKLIKDA